MNLIRSFLGILFSFSSIAVVNASEASCPKCVLIRKANEEKAKSQTWVFYEDWLETDEGKASQKEEANVSFEDDQDVESDQNKE